MKEMKINMRIILITLIVILFETNIYPQDKPSLCFTFDDGNPKSILDYEYQEWNQMILDTLKNNNLQAILYVCGKKLDNLEGNEIIKLWDDAEHLIANHTYNHLNYNNVNVSFKDYKEDILKCDSLINGYKHYSKLFRAPYLKNGDTKGKRDSLIAYQNK